MAVDFDFSDLTPQTATVEIGGRSFVLKEATEDQAVKFKNMSAKAAKFKDGDLTGIEGAANVEPYLLSLCMVEIDPDGKEKPVLESFVRTLPSRVVSPLFDWVRDASGLGGKDTVESIDKKLAELTKKRAELVKGGDGPKGLPSGSETTST